MKGIINAMKRRTQKDDKQQQDSTRGSTVSSAQKSTSSSTSSGRRGSFGDKNSSPSNAAPDSSGASSSGTPTKTAADVGQASPTVSPQRSSNAKQSTAAPFTSGSGADLSGPTVDPSPVMAPRPASPGPAFSPRSVEGTSGSFSGADASSNNANILDGVPPRTALPSSKGIPGGVPDSLKSTPPPGGLSSSGNSSPSAAGIAGGTNSLAAPSTGAVGGRSPKMGPIRAGTMLNIQPASPPPRASSLVGGSGIQMPQGIVFEDGEPFAVELPILKDTPAPKRLELFRKKLHLCSIVFDFNMPHLYQKERDVKRRTLVELVEYINARTCFNEQIIGDVVAMVQANVFRALPPNGSSLSNPSAVYEPEEEEPILESAWPHLQVVYEFFLRFVVSPETDAKFAKKFIEQTFVLKLLELFDSEDPRERDYLKTILHRIYGKIMAMRSFIRKAIQHVFFKSLYEKEVQHGIAELLEILGSIVNGFALPLKEEHKVFLEKSLIPLFKARTLGSYHQYLGYCMTQYVEKDCRLAETIILGLLKYWPATNTSKEVIFVNEIEEILEQTQVAEFQVIMEPLFTRLALCIASPHFQVAERVLFLWNNELVVKLINQNRLTLFPIIMRALLKNSKEHWNSTVNGLTYNVSKLLAQADPTLFDDCNNKNQTREAEKGKEDKERNKFWAQLQAKYGNQAALASASSSSVTTITSR